MSKSNDVSTPNHRPLADSELDAVGGGFFESAIADALADAADLTADDSWSAWLIGW